MMMLTSMAVQSSRVIALILDTRKTQDAADGVNKKLSRVNINDSCYMLPKHCAAYLKLRLDPPSG